MWWNSKVLQTQTFIIVWYWNYNLCFDFSSKLKIFHAYYTNYILPSIKALPVFDHQTFQMTYFITKMIFSTRNSEFCKIFWALFPKPFWWLQLIPITVLISFRIHGQFYLVFLRLLLLFLSLLTFELPAEINHRTHPTNYKLWLWRNEVLETISRCLTIVFCQTPSKYGMSNHFINNVSPAVKYIKCTF